MPTSPSNELKIIITSGNADTQFVQCRRKVEYGAGQQGWDVFNFDKGNFRDIVRKFEETPTVSADSKGETVGGQMIELRSDEDKQTDGEQSQANNEEQPEGDEQQSQNDENQQEAIDVQQEATDDDGKPADVQVTNDQLDQTTDQTTSEKTKSKKAKKKEKTKKTKSKKPKEEDLNWRPPPIRVLHDGWQFLVSRLHVPMRITVDTPYICTLIL